MAHGCPTSSTREWGGQGVGILPIHRPEPDPQEVVGAVGHGMAPRGQGFRGLGDSGEASLPSALLQPRLLFEGLI